MANLLNLIICLICIIFLLNQSHSLPTFSLLSFPVNSKILQQFLPFDHLRSLPTLIIGGRSAKFKEFPLQVAFRFEGKDRAFCGGSIITCHWILTAAHCFEYDFGTIQVVYGAIDLPSFGSDSWHPLNKWLSTNTTLDQDLPWLCFSYVLIHSQVQDLSISWG